MESSNQSNLEVLEEIKQLESEILILKGGIEWEEWFEEASTLLESVGGEMKTKRITGIMKYRANPPNANTPR